MIQTEPQRRFVCVRVFSALLIALLVLAGVTACDQKSEQTSTVTIGVSLPLTGPAASYGESARKGVQIAYDEFLAKHPDFKGRIVLDIQDDKASPKDGITVYRKFRAGGAPIIVGPMVSGVAIAVTDLAKNDDVLFILPSATNPRLRGRSPLVYRTCVSDDVEGSAVARFAHKRDPEQKLAVLYINNEYGLGIATVFADTYRNLGGTVSLSEGYDAAATSFRDIATKVRSSGADVVFLVGQKEQLQVIRQLREAGFTGQLYGTTMFEDPQLLQSSAAEGAIFSTRVLADGSKGAQPHPFFTEYRKRFGGESDYYAATFYDGTSIALLCAAELLKDPKADLQILPRTVGVQNGATGSLEFDDQNDVRQPFSFKQVKDGSVEILP